MFANSRNCDTKRKWWGKHKRRRTWKTRSPRYVKLVCLFTHLLLFVYIHLSTVCTPSCLICTSKLNTEYPPCTPLYLLLSKRRLESIQFNAFNSIPYAYYFHHMWLSAVDLPLVLYVCRTFLHLFVSIRFFLSIYRSVYLSIYQSTESACRYGCFVITLYRDSTTNIFLYRVHVTVWGQFSELICVMFRAGIPWRTGSGRVSDMAWVFHEIFNIKVLT